VAETVAYREELLAQKEIIGARISYNAILIKCTALILKEMPIFNASVKGEEVHIWNETNIGLALDLEGGLVVPVIRNADKRSLAEIQKALEDLIERGRKHRLSPDEIKGGTFTVSNFGSYGTLYGTPIINPPEVALLGLGIIRQMPVVKNGEIGVGWTMNYSLTMDHRVIDGATGGRFINRIREMLAYPNLLGVKW